MANRRQNWLWLVTGVLAIISALLVLGAPTINLYFLGAVIVFTVMFSGVSQIVNYFYAPKELRDPWYLATGIITLVMSFWVATRADGTFYILIVPYLCVMWVLMGGISAVASYRPLKLLDTRLATISLWGGVAAIVLAGIMFFFPGIVGLTFNTLLALVLLVEGVMSIVRFFEHRTRNVRRPRKTRAKNLA